MWRVDNLDENSIHGQAHPYPLYDDYREFPNTYDVDVVVLDEPYNLPAGQYGQLPALGLLDTLARGQVWRDRVFTAVGYGLHGYVPPYYRAERTRYQSQVSLIEVKIALTGDGQGAKLTGNPGKGNGSGGTCFGDSGGPVFRGVSNVVGAVVSWGITPCIGVDYQFRMDTRGSHCDPFRSLKFLQRQALDSGFPPRPWHPSGQAPIGQIRILL